MADCLGHQAHRWTPRNTLHAVWVTCRAPGRHSMQLLRLHSPCALIKESTGLYSVTSGSDDKYCVICAIPWTQLTLRVTKECRENVTVIRRAYMVPSRHCHNESIVWIHSVQQLAVTAHCQAHLLL